MNEGREILGLHPLDGGDVFILRGEYKVGHTLEEIHTLQAAQIAAKTGRVGQSSEGDRDAADSDSMRPDSEGYGSHGDTDTGDVTSTSQDRWSENAN